LGGIKINDGNIPEDSGTPISGKVWCRRHKGRPGVDRDKKRHALAVIMGQVHVSIYSIDGSLKIHQLHVEDLSLIHI
jgi:hypothetical protein